MVEEKRREGDKEAKTSRRENRDEEEKDSRRWTAGDKEVWKENETRRQRAEIRT